MVNVHTATTALLEFLQHAGVVTVHAVSKGENWLREQLLGLGLPRNAQTVILVAMIALLIVSAVRLVAGLLRVAVLLVLSLIAIHILVAAV